jgi:ribonuclease HI
VTILNQSENIILDLLEPLNSCNNLLIIQKTLSSFNNNTQYIFEFYTDGSLINLGTEQCSTSCSFAHLNTEFDIPQVEFATKIDNWPSAYRGELLAVILALCVVPKNSKVRINTDSLNVLTQFEKLKKINFHQTSREYFKNNNNYLWNILCRIILQLNLHVELFKVVAHRGDIGNDYVDHLAKEVHFNQDAYVNFKNDANLMKVLPKWNGILIENRLRSFIKMICNFKDMEKFLNLYRNSKYKRLEVNWTSTFQCLNCDILKNETSISSSKVKAQKVHLMIEEIPTLEQMKKSFFELYDEWKCPICGLENKTFNHV